MFEPKQFSHKNVKVTSDLLSEDTESGRYYLLDNGKKLPLNLGQALKNLSFDNHFINKIGKEFISSYLKLKELEWNDYLAQFSEWELKNTLDI